MIRSSFSFIPGIGDKTEKMLWAAGVFTWDDLSERKNRLQIGKDKRVRIEEYLEKAHRALVQYDATFFADYLSSKDYWRIYREFAKKTLFLDVETTGLSLYYDRITLIGTFNGEGIRYFIRDNNLEEFSDYLTNYQVVVTFNGKLFDIPFIKKQFPNIKLPPVHVDLRYLLRSIGVIGSLKKIESNLGILRPSELQGINGREAVVLWSRFLKGDDQALEKLLVYNSYDTVNLQTLLDYCYRIKTSEIRNRMEVATYQLELGHEPAALKEHFVVEQPYFNALKVQIKHVDSGLLDVYLNGEKLLNINRDSVHRTEVKLTPMLRKIRSRGISPISIGIDLTGSEERASGFCILKEHQAYMDLLKTDEDIIARVQEVKPSIISIDSPLNLPKGRCCPSDACECRKHGIMRECERILKSRGINVYPCLIPSMQNLTMRGIRLSKLLREKGYEVIESYPGAAQDILGLPRKRVDLRALEIDLMSMGIKPISTRKIITHDEIDALTSALVGYFYQAGQFESLGNPEEGYLIIPSIDNDNK
jgi:uncharacterized protein YprB with RNaseH-like and TPR domain/predicted nuclease with RNAse H fold